MISACNMENQGRSFNAKATNENDESGPHYLPPLHFRFPRMPPIQLNEAHFSLSEISQASITEDCSRFTISGELQAALQQAQMQDVTALTNRVFNEAAKYATDSKENARAKLKLNQKRVENSLTTIEKGKLRSRREARVHRIKKKAFERALKDAIKWLIEDLSQRTRGRSLNNATMNP